MSDFTRTLITAFGPDRVCEQAPLAPFTTFRVGGPADWLVEVRNAEELQRAVTLAHQAGIGATVLGGGSNVLVSDRGVRGLVVRVRGGRIALLGEGADQDHAAGLGTPVALVRADAGVTINALVRWTINHGLEGLEAWAGTPGTVGGGVFGNAHYGGRLLGDLIDRVRLIAPDGRVSDVEVEQMEFGYDRSRLQRSGEVLLWAVFRLAPGRSPADLRTAARRSLAYRKQTQPLDTPSAGCIFQNPDPDTDPLAADLPASAGALIDRAGLKAIGIGGARVSTTHANFIVNEGSATATDIRRLIELCRETVKERFGVVLREEIVYVGAW